jgi:hypothetical protein
MDVQFQLKLPYSGWDYFPLPNVASTAEQPSLLFDINFQLPAFVARLFGVDIPQKTPTQTSYEPPPESPFVSEVRRLIETGNFSLCEEGVGGTYFINNPDGTIKAIFKPSGTHLYNNKLIFRRRAWFSQQPQRRNQKPYFASWRG